METRTLGRTGLEVSVLGFGALTIGGAFGPVDDASSIKALHAAIDAGMNFIDTSDAYGAGHSETLVGQFLKERSDRDEIIVCTKGGNNMVTGVRNFTPDYIRGCVGNSLKRLEIDVIDLYLLHNPTLDNMKAEDSYDVLDDFKAKGVIKHWGVSVNTLEECEYTVSSGRPATMQMEYNLLEQGPQAVFAKAQAAGIGVISRVPLKRGMLSGRFNEQTTFAETDLRGRILSADKMPGLVEKVQQIEAAAASLNRPLAEIALRFCVSNPDIAVTIPGVRTVEQAQSNAAASEPLPAEVVEVLRQIG